MSAAMSKLIHSPQTTKGGVFEFIINKTWFLMRDGILQKINGRKSDVIYERSLLVIRISIISI